MKKKHNTLEIKDLNIKFKSSEHTLTAVNGISFTVQEGEILGVAGESGSGKSVTALHILKLLQSPPAIANAQQMLLSPSPQKNIDLNTSSPKVVNAIRGKLVGMIFQDPMSSLNPVMTCGAQLVETLVHHGSMSEKEAKSETIRLFKKVQLQNPERIFSAYPHQLSGGQKQRIIIAQAISLKPRLLLADEPTTALDVTTQKSVLDLLLEIQKETNMSVILISHDLNVLRNTADRILIMKDGNIVEENLSEKIFTAATHPYTKALLAAIPPRDKKVFFLPEVQNDNIPYFETIPATAIQKKEQLLSTAPSLISVKNLSVTFTNSNNIFSKKNNQTSALKGVSFELKKGETLGIVGESGSGKTTLGRAILQLQEYEKGEVFFQGQRLNFKQQETLGHFRKNCQIVFQNPYSSLNPRRTIGQAILEPMELYKLHENKKKRKEKALELLETVGLQAEHFSRFPKEFSGGQKQRIGIARALACAPQFIVLDEAVSALDVSVQAKILNLLVALREKFDLTYLFITHDMAVVRFISDRIAVMQSGKIVEYGPTENIFNNPQHDYTKTLLSALI